MWYEDIVLIGKYPKFNDEPEERVKVVVRFFNEEKHKEFAEAQNKSSWLQRELGLKEWVFRDTYVDYRDNYFKESDENQVLKELLGAVVYIID